MAFTNLLEVLYPVGSVYISTLSTSPAEVIGGTWTQIDGAVLRGGGAVEYVGADAHTLTVSEMPSHEHETSVDNGKLFQDPGNTGRSTFLGSFYKTGTPKGSWLTTFPAGGSQPHSIVQRSFNCFIWYRTA